MKEPALMIWCDKDYPFTDEQKRFLHSKCFKCTRSILNASERKNHALARKRDHFAFCTRCENHFDKHENAKRHVIEIHAMFLGDALSAGFKEVVERSEVSGTADEADDDDEADGADADGDDDGVMK